MFKQLKKNAQHAKRTPYKVAQNSMEMPDKCEAADMEGHF